LLYKVFHTFTWLLYLIVYSFYLYACLYVSVLLIKKQAQQIKAREQQQLQMQQLQLMQHRNVQLQRRDPNHPALGGSVNTNSEGMMGHPSASILAMKLYEERVKNPQSVDSETSSALIDANRMALLKTQANPHRYEKLILVSIWFPSLQFRSL